MLNLTSYPQCAKRLHFQRCRLDEKGFNSYWAAACVADEFTDKELTEYGGFNFDDRSDENGYRQLALLEKFMIDRRTKAKAHENSPAFERKRLAKEREHETGVVAFLGSRGVKTSALKSENDYWLAAEILFPGKIERAGGFTSLYAQIQSIPKKTRGELGRENLHRIPAEWLGKVVRRRPDLCSQATGATS